MNFTVVYVGFIIMVCVYRVRRLSKSYAHKEEPSEVKKPVSYAIMLCLYLLVFIGSIMEYFFINYGQEVNLVLSGVGFLLYVSVMHLRGKALKALGIYVSPDVEIKEDHQLIRNGLYRYIRHPLALCVILELIGFTLVSNSYYSLTGVILLFIPFMLYRIKMEEKALIEKFGQDYLDYKKEVPALIPFKSFFCKRR